MSRKTQRAEGQTTVTLSLSADLLKRIDVLAIKDARKRSPYIVRLLEEYADDLVVRLPVDLLARIDRLAAADQRTRESWIAKVLMTEIDRTRGQSGEPEVPSSPRRHPPSALPAPPTVRTQTDHGPSKYALNEDAAESQRPTKGQPHPKSTRGIRQANRPPDPKA